jgi:anti-sigma28 factor (negative regulator of flagellin synthesis)
MKIVDQSNLSPAQAPGTKSAVGVESGERREAGRAAATGDGRDSAELSGLAGKISQAIGKDSANRAAVVEKLRPQVASGTYKVDAQRPATALSTTHWPVPLALAEVLRNDHKPQARAGCGSSGQCGPCDRTAGTP